MGRNNERNGSSNRVGKPHTSSAKAQRGNPAGKTAQHILHKLPPELRAEVYQHTLIAKRTVQIRDKIDTSSGLPYYFQERPAKLNADLKRALSFHSKGVHTNLSHEAHAYFLQHNKFVVRNTVSANALVKVLDDLSRAGHPTSIFHLCVRTPLPQELYNGGNDSDGRIGSIQETDASYGPRDHHLPGPGNYRILLPLLKLQRPPQNFTVITNMGSYNPAPGNHHFNNAIEYVAAVIAKLKDMVMEGSNSASFSIYDSPSVWNKKEDYNWLWETPNEAEKAQMNQYLADRQELEGLLRHVEGLRCALHPRRARTGGRPISSIDKSRSRASLIEEKKDLGTKLSEISIRMKPFLMNDKLADRCRVYELAMDPNWEAKVESEATSSWLPDDSHEDWTIHSSDEETDDDHEPYNNFTAHGATEGDASDTYVTGLVMHWRGDK